MLSLLSKLLPRRKAKATTLARTTRLALEALEDRSVPSVVAGEFPGQGGWRFRDRGDVVAHFPGVGVLRFEDTVGWQVLAQADPLTVSIAGNGTVVMAMRGPGVYRFVDTIGWQLLSTGVAIQADIDNAGEVVSSF